jgi:hypothetical protein
VRSSPDLPDRLSRTADNVDRVPRYASSLIRNLHPINPQRPIEPSQVTRCPDAGLTALLVILFSMAITKKKNPDIGFERVIFVPIPTTQPVLSQIGSHLTSHAVPS